MSPRPRPAASLVALLLFASACTGGGSSGSTHTSEAPVPSSQESPSPVPTAPGSAAAALAKLCVYPPPSPPSGGTEEGPTSPAIAQVERQVEQIRGLDLTERVPVDAVDHAGLVKGLQESFDASYPAALYERRSRAWQTIGAIPAGSSIRQALQDFVSGQVIGYYDPSSGQLVFIGAEDPNGVERDTLAHELTHAVDDQHFGLSRLDHLSSTCQDEAFDAALAVTEGDATYVQVVYAQRYLTLEEQLQLGSQPAPSTAGIPPFVLKLETWPYIAGFAFVQALVTRGGEEAVNHAFTDLPVSTEQIIHPERYPNDMPQPLDVPDLGLKLGPGWTDLDVQGVGEEWLSILLGLRLDTTTAGSAAAGWDGGIYRAWSDGDRVAVVMSTAWDTPQDASEFASAMQQWISADSQQEAIVRPVDGEHVQVQVLFASDGETLTALEQAVS